MSRQSVDSCHDMEYDRKARDKMVYCFGRNDNGFDRTYIRAAARGSETLE